MKEFGIASLVVRHMMPWGTLLQNRDMGRKIEGDPAT
jgi:hypothetical protein